MRLHILHRLRGSEGSHLHSAQACEPRVLQFAPVKHVERIEGDEALAVRMSDVDAALLHTPYIEGFSINELHNQHAKQILVAEVFWNEDPGQTAEQFAQRRYL